MSRYVERFWEYVVNRHLPDACWLWHGPKKPDGYGFFTVRDPRKRTAYAHRHAYEQLVGPIPPGLTIDHLCRTEACVNPSHMEVVTRSENNRRRRGYNTKSHCRHGHEFTPENTRIDKRGFQVCRTCHAADQRRYSERQAA